MDRFIRCFMVFIVALCAMVSFINCKNCDELGVSLYKSLGCTAKTVDDEGCPTEYNCEFTSDNQTCYLEGKTHKLGEGAVSYEAPCNGNCTCSEGLDKLPTFSCESQSCPEFPELDPNCTFIFQPGACCPTGVKCLGKDLISKCVLDGDVLFEGSTRDRNNSCEVCTCTQSGLVCRQRTCMARVQLFEQSQVRRFCAPVYLAREIEDNLLCCVQTFICPVGDEIMKEEVSADSKETSCRFGTNSVKLGDTFNKTLSYIPGVSWELKCECQLPPYVTCIEVQNT